MIIVKYVAKTLGWKTGGSELSLFLWTLQVGNVVFGIWLNGRKGGGKGDFQGLGDWGMKGLKVIGVVAAALIFRWLCC